MTRCTMRNRSQGALCIQRAMARLAEKDVHRWVFAHSMDPEVEVEFTVRGWPFRLDDLGGVDDMERGMV